MVDLGTQERKPFQGQVKAPARAMMLFFEFPEILHKFKEDSPEEPMVKSMQFPFFSDEKSKLAKFCLSWLSKAVPQVDFSDLPGEAASITIAHQVSEANGKTYDNVTSIAPVSPKLLKMMPARVNKTMLFSIQIHGFDSDEFNQLYPWVQEVVKKSEEYQKWESNQRPVASDNYPADDDIPF